MSDPLAATLSTTAQETVGSHGIAPTRPMMIEIDGFSKKYGNHLAVSDVNIHVPAGELYCVVGPNGAGKTSTFKSLVGLLRPTTGTLRIGGFDIQANPVEAKRLIGYIPDQPYLYDKLSGRDMARFVADLFGTPWQPALDRVLHYAELFKLSDMFDQLIENYSHGMRQKLCFSLALMHEPKVLVVDEPMVGLDPQSSRIVKNLLREECKRGACVFLSTHTLVDVEEIADRIAIFRKGKVIFQGTLAQLRLARGSDQGSLEDLFLQMTLEDNEYRRLKGDGENAGFSFRAGSDRP